MRRRDWMKIASALALTPMPAAPAWVAKIDGTVNGMYYEYEPVLSFFIIHGVQHVTSPSRNFIAHFLDTESVEVQVQLVQQDDSMFRFAGNNSDFKVIIDGI
jgi:hypothetical protein